MLAWAGLGIPVPLTAEQRSTIRPKFDFPPGRNEALTEWFKATVLTAIEKYGYEPATCFRWFLSFPYPIALTHSPKYHLKSPTPGMARHRQDPRLIFL